MSLSRVASTLTLVCMVGAGACDSGPKGPGTLPGTVTGERLGGVVLEVTGPGIQGFEGLGSTRAYSAPLDGVQHAHRVILIDPEGGELHFGINVEDIGALSPAITVVSATDTDDFARLTAGIQVRLVR